MVEFAAIGTVLVPEMVRSPAAGLATQSIPNAIPAMGRERWQLDADFR